MFCHSQQRLADEFSSNGFSYSRLYHWVIITELFTYEQVVSEMVLFVNWILNLIALIYVLLADLSKNYNMYYISQ